jgi:hypothetical protein
VNDTIDGEIARYATAVRAAFADLPAPERELLLEDLEDHLQEVAAEGGGPLAERLGPPEGYAAELRASAGLPAPGARRRRAGSWLQATWGAQQLDRLWRAVSTHPAGRSVLDFLPELRPAWWVLRGYLAVQAVAVAASRLFQGVGLSFPVPALFDSRVLGLIATGAAVAVSVALGRHRQAASRRTRALTVAGNAALAVFAVLMMLELGANEASGDLYHPEYVTSYSLPLDGLRSNGNEISNIFAFDADGKLLRDVYLVDQEGNPVVASHDDNELLEQPDLVDRDGNEVANRYPRAQRQFDLDSGQSTPVPAPAFRPPPGPVRSPDEPAGGSGTGP